MRTKWVRSACPACKTPAHGCVYEGDMTNHWRCAQLACGRTWDTRDGYGTLPSVVEHYTNLPPVVQHIRVDAVFVGEVPAGARLCMFKGNVIVACQDGSAFIVTESGLIPIKSAGEW